MDANSEKPRKRKRGEHTKLTDKIQEAIVLSMESGTPMAIAAEAAGVSAETAMEWVRRGEGRDERPASLIYVSFAKSVAQAKAIALDHAVKVIRTAMSKNWQAAAWFAERTCPEHFALKTKTELTGKDGAALIPPNFDLNQLTDEELERVGNGDYSPIRARLSR